MNDLVVLRDECIECKRCSIGGQLIEKQFLSNVFSNMNQKAKIMVVGQNPGRDEVEKKEPFVGMAGKRFDEILFKVVGITRADLYISNSIRCHTPGNRKPSQNEEDNCREFLDKEIAIIKPKIIVALGSVAFRQLTGMNGIMKHHGSITFSIRYHVPVLPVLHPSPLNMNNPEREQAFYDDLLKLKELISGYNR
jgi:uracil-DNA glycosylase family 4